MRILPTSIYRRVENGSSILQGIKVIVITKRVKEIILMIILIFWILLILAIFCDKEFLRLLYILMMIRKAINPHNKINSVVSADIFQFNLSVISRNITQEIVNFSCINKHRICVRRSLWLH